MRQQVGSELDFIYLEDYSDTDDKYYEVRFDDSLALTKLDVGEHTLILESYDSDDDPSGVLYTDTLELIVTEFDRPVEGARNCVVLKDSFVMLIYAYVSSPVPLPVEYFVNM